MKIGIFLLQDMEKHLQFLLISFYIAQCSAGVVSRNINHHKNDILSMALEQSEVENVQIRPNNSVQISIEKLPEVDTLENTEPLNSLEVSSFNSSGTKNSSDLDSRNLSISRIVLPESLNFTGDVSEESKDQNQLSDSDLQKGKISEMTFKDSNDSMLVPTSRETTSFSTHVKFSNSTVSEIISDNITDFGIIGEASFLPVSNQTGLTELDWPLSTDDETDILNFEILFNFSNESTLVSLSNNTALNLTHIELLNGTISEVISDNMTDLISLGGISNQSGALPQLDWSQSNINVTETRFEDFEIQIDGSGFIMSNDTEINHILNFSDLINDTIEEINKSFGLNSDFAEMVSGEQGSLTTVNASEGILSNLGLEFLTNSEVAKNAAMAMEVFNFTDSSLTDHIIEENAFLNLVVPTLGDGHNLNSSIAPEVKLLNLTSENSSNSVEEFEVFEENTNEDKNSTLIVAELMEIETETLHLFNLTEFINGNETLEKISNFTEHLELNETLTSNISTLSNETDFSENTLAEFEIKNATNAEPECPPPGMCLFWFLSQDTCAVNSHCLGSQICCRIRCSKTCIDV